LRRAAAGGYVRAMAGEREHGSEALFLLSFRQRDELAQQAAAAGWQVVAARRADGLSRRWLASGARVAVVDARGALDEGMAAAEALGGHVAAEGAAMLALVSRGDVAHLPRFFDLGATHFLASPATEAEFDAALRYAARHAARMAGEWRPRPAEEPLGWEAAAGRVRLTPALARRMDGATETGAAALLRRLDPADRSAALAALRRLRTRSATAVAHELPPLGRVVTHLQRAPGGSIVAVVELLAIDGDAAARVQAAGRGGRDAGAAEAWLAARLAAGAPAAVLLAALTRYDIVNAAYGRAAGDAMLAAAQARIARVARDLFGEAALVQRTGGAEFLLALSGEAERVAIAADAVATALARPFAADGEAALLGSRIGLASAVPGDTADALIGRAADALADAKASDAGTTRVAGPAGVAAADALAVDLHRALARGEIEVRFQPQVAFADGRIVGVEALARWQHPRLGALGAPTLFAAAERADLGLALSEHVQALALAAAAVWPAGLADLRLSINVTAADLARPDFAAALLARLAGHELAAERLTVEVTESGFIQDLPSAAKPLARLRRAGCRVAVDDFGTGYSSLAYLRALPLDLLKLDKAMAQAIAGSARDRVVVEGVIAMARELGLAVVAEGVETAEQRDRLAAAGCTLYQGFLCAEALDVPALTQLVEDRRCERS
jgi:EAL domain-containing protein (putative c-di-GMP-specific phosphodiesterase class I)/GGDEF domain-containing protein